MGRSPAFFAVLLLPSLIAADIAEAAVAEPRQVMIETQFVETQRSTLRELGFNLQPLTPTIGAPTIGAIQSYQLGDILNSIQANEAGQILAAPRLVVLEDQAATFSAGGFLTAPSKVPGVEVTFEDFGIELTVIPQVTPDGKIVLDIKTASDEINSGPTTPIVNTRRASTALSLQNDQTLAIGGLVSDELKAEADRIPGLGDLPILGPLFKGGSQAAQTMELIIFLTPRISGMTSGSSSGTTPPASGGGTTTTTAAPSTGSSVSTTSSSSRRGGRMPFFEVAPGQFFIDVGANAVYDYMPNFNWLRLEDGINIIEQPFLSEKTDIIAPEIVIGGGVGLDWSLLFGGKSRLRFGFSYLDGDTDSFEEFVSTGGEGLGVNLPDGNAIFVPGGMADLQDVNFNLSYKAVNFDIQLFEEIPLGNKALTVGGGVDFRYAKSKTSLSFLTDNFSTQFERSDKIKNYSAGPVISATLSHNYGLLTSYGGLSVRAMASFADGWTGVDQDGFSQGEFDPSKTEFTYETEATAGLRFNLDPIKLDLRGSFGYGNNNPILIYPEFQEAEIDFKNDMNWTAGAEVTYTFD
ncbi:MAG: type II and III secretion system protein [Alphaproteobacteria bacterium]|nr:type II and III secretion system protein [Alphaproteobacteria bacterium]